MNWKAIYKERLTNADEAVKRIKSGDRVSVGNAVGAATARLSPLGDSHAIERLL